MMEILQFIILIILAPLFQGIIKKFKAYFQGRQGFSIFQPYQDLKRLFIKDMVISKNCSFVFHITPYIVLFTTALCAMLLPVISFNSIFSSVGDLITFIYLLGFGRFFMILAGLDAGTAFGGEGSSREATVSMLVEPMLMLSLFAVLFARGSTNFFNVINGNIYTPSLLLGLSAYVVALLAETGRIPIDNPDTHLELTMIHEGMLLEYSGKYLALMELAHYIKQTVLMTLFLVLFFPFGITQKSDILSLLISTLDYVLKMIILCIFIAFAESSRAKMRFFQLPSLLGGAFVLSALSLIVLIIMGK